jgi:hypothetical protein
MIVEVLHIAQRNPEHPLAKEGYDFMLDQVLPPHVVKARTKPPLHVVAKKLYSISLSAFCGT